MEVYGMNSRIVVYAVHRSEAASLGSSLDRGRISARKWFPVAERVKLRFDAQFFNVFNHPKFGLPSMVLAGVPSNPETQTGFGALTYTTSPITGLLGVGLGGDSSPRMIAFQARLEF
jgi:hypothetical protein